MKIFRAINEKEKFELIENNILSPRNTYRNDKWILNPHPEDNQTGKFFFFTMEDAMYFARKVHFALGHTASIIEMDINESIILPYLAYGVYVYPDYDKNGEWDNFCEHTNPELLLPYILVNENLSNKKFKLIELKKENYYKIDMPYDSERPKSYVNMGKILSKLIVSRREIAYNKKQLETLEHSYYRKSLEVAQAKYDEYKTIFPKIFDEFMKCQREYNWEDSIKNKEVIGTIIKTKAKNIHLENNL